MGLPFAGGAASSNSILDTQLASSDKRNSSGPSLSTQELAGGVKQPKEHEREGLYLSPSLSDEPHAADTQPLIRLTCGDKAPRGAE